MAIFVDHVGLNTLVSSSLDLTTNTIESNVNNAIASIPAEEKLVGINLHRNGPYGYSSWTQLRASQNPITRHQIKNSDFSFVATPGDLVNISPDENSVERVRERHSRLHLFEEPVVTQKFKPLVWNVGRHFSNGRGIDLKRFSIVSSYGNNLVSFSNDQVNKLLRYNVKDDDQEYEFIKEYYLNGSLEEENSPLTHWEFLKYGETIFPRPENMFRKEVRDRVTFSSFYRKKRLFHPLTKSLREVEDRTKIITGTSVFPRPYTGSHADGTIRDLLQSSWPMDEAQGFLTTDGTSMFLNDIGSGFTPLFGNIRFSTSIIDGVTREGGEGALMGRHVVLGGGSTGKLQETNKLNNTDPAVRAEGVERLNRFLVPHALYMRRHMYETTASVSNPSGMRVPETASITLHKVVGGNDNKFMMLTAFEGGAAWEAGAQAGMNPFYDRYEDYNHEFRSKYKSFSILPEFRVSNHVDKIIKSGSAYFEQDLFELTGSELNNSDSSKQNFYKTYSTTDFLKHFELIGDDHDSFVNSQVLTLKCKVVKKLLPYDGFYPCQRTAKMAEQFYSSYNQNFAARTEDILNEDFGFKFLGAEQAIMAPLFAPGVLFNAIKSGVAVDYPVITNDLEVHKRLSPATLFAIKNSNFDKRIPFEALVTPEEFMANIDLFSNEVHASASLTASATWDGRGDVVYKLMANNFLAEVPEFFLNNQNFTTIVSARQGDPNFGVVEANKTYAMRVRMYKTMNKTRNAVFNNTSLRRYYPPQDIIANNVRENFTMYSRPTAFGPPTAGHTMFTSSGPGAAAGGLIAHSDLVILDQHRSNSSGTGQGGLVNADARYQFDHPGNYTGQGGGAGSIRMIMGSEYGFNFPFTPPYYHGEAWADILYTPSTSGKKTLGEILSEIQVEYTRYDFDHMLSRTNGAGRVINASIMGAEAASGTNLNVGAQSFENNRINKNAVQLSSSMNLFGRGSLKSIDLVGDGTNQEFNVVVNTQESNEDRWVLQTKFETPMLNFNHISVANGTLTVPSSTNTDFSRDHGAQNAAAQVPRGMWHQLGKIPEENEGVFIRVSPLDDPWQEYRLGKDPDKERGTSGALYEDLSKVCGFSTEPVKLGRIAGAKVIREAVVAVPFIEENNRKKFFRIDEGAVSDFLNGTALSNTELGMGLSIKQQITKMKRYIFPPSFDFINNPTVDPIAMYIFEFKHTLDQDDLANIWQGLPPKIARTHDEAEAKITHPLLAKELLGGGRPGDNSTHKLPDELKWMVFKVKQRAASNYFEKVTANNPQSIIDKTERLSRVAVDQFGATTTIQFNWPYDFFSLVELAKLEAEIEFGDADYSNFFEVLPERKTISASPPAITRINEEYKPLPTNRSSQYSYGELENAYDRLNGNDNNEQGSGGSGSGSDGREREGDDLGPFSTQQEKDTFEKTVKGGFGSGRSSEDIDADVAGADIRGLGEQAFQYAQQQQQIQETQGDSGGGVQGGEEPGGGETGTSGKSTGENKGFDPGGTKPEIENKIF